MFHLKAFAWSASRQKQALEKHALDLIDAQSPFLVGHAHQMSLKQFKDAML